jgi:hypothetical protein
MEEFFKVLTTRGVRIGSSEQAVALGSAVADIARALGMVEEPEVAPEGNGPAAQSLATAATAPAWPNGS